MAASCCQSAGAASGNACCSRACARHDPAPPRAPRGDIVLPVETQVIEAIVPRQATLESLLLDHELPLHLVHAAIESARVVFNPRQLRAERPYRLVLSVDGLLREFEYQIDADRFLRIVNRDRSTPEKLDAEVLPYDKDMEVVGIRGAHRSGRIRRSSRRWTRHGRAHASWRSRSPRSSAGRSTSTTTCSPDDSFDVLFESTKYQGQFAGYGAIVERAARQRGQGVPAPIAGATRRRRRRATTTSRADR